MAMGIKKITVHNQTIAYKEAGQGDVLVLLHGFCGSMGYWDRVLPELAKKYRVIAPDLPGHGESDVSGHTIEHFAEQLELFFTALNLDQVTLLGHSLGGYVTLAYAERFATRLKAFSLIHSTGFPDSEEGKIARNNNIEKVKNEGIGSVVEGLIPKLFSPDHIEKNEAEIAFAMELGLQTTDKGAVAALKAMRDRISRNHVLAKSNCPILLVAGEGDQLIPAERTFSVKKENIDQVLISGAGHMSMLETPDILLQEIKKWLIGRA